MSGPVVLCRSNQLVQLSKVALTFIIIESRLLVLGKLSSVVSFFGMADAPDKTGVHIHRSTYFSQSFLPQSLVLANVFGLERPGSPKS